jgi:hypothetical protein
MVLAISGLLVNGQMDTTHNKMKIQQITIKVTDLPKAVTENIAKDYPGYNITEAYTGMMSDGCENLKTNLNLLPQPRPQPFHSALNETTPSL